MGNLASVVDELLAVDPRDLPTPALGEEIVELYRQASRLHAAILDRIEAFDRTGGAKASRRQTPATARVPPDDGPTRLPKMPLQHRRSRHLSAAQFAIATCGADRSVHRSYISG